MDEISKTHSKTIGLPYMLLMLKDVTLTPQILQNRKKKHRP
jgi:hypothetical protein